MPQLEYIRGLALDVKADAETGRIEGYGSVFGVEDLGGDVVESGAFRESLAAGRVPKMLWQHDAGRPLGVWEEADEDETGLRLRGRVLTDTTLGRDAIAFIRAGAVDGLSIGYRVIKADTDAKGVRTIRSAELWEVSVVTFPMNEAARIHGVKSAAEVDAMTETDIERRLREVGSLSRAEAKRIVHRLLSIGEQRQAVALEEFRTASALRDLCAKLKG